MKYWHCIFDKENKTPLNPWPRVRWQEGWDIDIVIPSPQARWHEIWDIVIEIGYMVYENPWVFLDSSSRQVYTIGCVIVLTLSHHLCTTSFHCIACYKSFSLTYLMMFAYTWVYVFNLFVLFYINWWHRRQIEIFWV